MPSLPDPPGALEARDEANVALQVYSLVWLALVWLDYNWYCSSYLISNDQYGCDLEVNLAHVYLSRGQLALAREAVANAQVYK